MIQVRGANSLPMRYTIVGAELIEISPRSPDFNPIEDIFHNVKSQLVKEALYLRIEKESFEEFCVRVLETLFNLDSSIIDCTVAIMHDRLKFLAKNGGYRTKY